MTDGMDALIRFSFSTSFSQQTSTEHLFCARHPAGRWGFKEGSSGPCPRGLPVQQAGRCTDQPLQPGKAVLSWRPQPGAGRPGGALRRMALSRAVLGVDCHSLPASWRHTHTSSPPPYFPLLPSAFALPSGQLAPPLVGQRDGESIGSRCVPGTSGNHASAHGSWSPQSHLSLSSCRCLPPPTLPRAHRHGESHDQCPPRPPLRRIAT